MVSGTGTRRQIIGLIPGSLAFSCRAGPCSGAVRASVMRQGCRRRSTMPAGFQLRPGPQRQRPAAFCTQPAPTPKSRTGEKCASGPTIALQMTRNNRRSATVHTAPVLRLAGLAYFLVNSMVAAPSPTRMLALVPSSCPISNLLSSAATDGLACRSTTFET